MCLPGLLADLKTGGSGVVGEILEELLEVEDPAAVSGDLYWNADGGASRR